MPTRSERRRRLRAGTDPQRPLLRRRDLLIACAIAAAVGIGILVVVLISGGSGGETSSDETVTETFFPPYSPDSPDGLAVVDLARSSIEVLPRGEWPSLYDSFTPEYQQRCPRDQFVAKAVIVGEIQGGQQYKLRSAFRKIDGSWKISPTEGTDGCNAFDRLQS